jgi:hypothetical protein
MNICFFSVQHFGDNFFAQPFIRNICKNNPELSFNYWFFLGHFMFDNMENNLCALETVSSFDYISTLINGNPPEDIISTDQHLKNLFISNEKTPYFVFSYNSSQYIAFNIWCSSLNSLDIDVHSYINGIINNITNINNHFNMHIQYDHTTTIENLIPKINECDISLFNKFYNENVGKKYVFMYNYKPRSLHYPIQIDTVIVDLAIRYPHIIFIVPIYKSGYENIVNIKCCDRDFGCCVDISCKNLAMLSQIITFCNIVITLPSGSTWTFFNDKMNIQTFYILEWPEYAYKLNNWYKLAYNLQTNILQNIQTSDIEKLIKNI